jgi:adenine-specific DNA-methyltransferase
VPRTKKTDGKRAIDSCAHTDKERLNNPPMGLVTPDTDPDLGARQTYTWRG